MSIIWRSKKVEFFSFKRTLRAPRLTWYSRQTALCHLNLPWSGLPNMTDSESLALSQSSLKTSLISVSYCLYKFDGLGWLLVTWSSLGFIHLDSKWMKYSTSIDLAMGYTFKLFRNPCCRYRHSSHPIMSLCSINLVEAALVSLIESYENLFDNWLISETFLFLPPLVEACKTLLWLRLLAKRPDLSI